MDTDRSLVSTLYKSRAWVGDGFRYEGAVADLVREIETEAAAQGLTVSRWQTNGHGGHVEMVTWAVHRGERAASSGRQEEVVRMVWFSGAEGTTERCVAFRQISKLLVAVRSVS